MQSATSFFNRALFRKNLQRFWPLWLGYVLIWLLLLPLPLLNELADYHGVPTVADASYYLLQIGAYGGLVMGAVFGIFFAMAMFAYLTNPRATQGFHSMPVRRETLYATNYLTGLVCMVSALVLAFALAGITAACFGALDLTALGTALLAAVLSVLFFYSFAVLCMMFTGQILAAPVFYGTLNFLAVGMEYLVRTFAGNFLYGYSGYSAPETFAFLSPAWELVCVLDVSNVARVDRILSDGTYQVIRGGEYMLSGLGVLGIYAAVGIVLAVLGLLVYRRRASEATGSIVTVAWARPIFKYGVAVCAAFSLGQLIYFLVFGLNLHNGQYSLPGTIACMLFTGLLGYFAAEMLLHKSFRVWRTGRVGALVFSAVLVCFGVAMSLDLTGYEGYTPDAEEVEFVSVYLSSNGDYLSCKLDEPESIERTLAAHRAMIADKARQLSYARTTYETPADAPVDSYLYFTVTYALTDGRVVRRSYVDCRAFSRELNEPGSVAQTMTALLNCPEAALDRVLGELADDKSNAYLTGGYYDVVSDGAYGEDNGELTAAQANTLVSALRRDYEAGHASNASLFEDTLYSGSFYVELELWYSIRVDEKPTRQPIDTTSNSSGSVCAIVTPEMTCTLEALRAWASKRPRPRAASDAWLHEKSAAASGWSGRSSPYSSSASARSWSTGSATAASPARTCPRRNGWSRTSCRSTHTPAPVRRSRRSTAWSSTTSETLAPRRRQTAASSPISPSRMRLTPAPTSSWGWRVRCSNAFRSRRSPTAPRRRTITPFPSRSATRMRRASSPPRRWRAFCG